MTRNTHVARFQVHLFEDYIILGLTKEWSKFFKDKPYFDVEIDNKGRLILKGPMIEVYRNDK